MEHPPISRREFFKKGLAFVGENMREVANAAWGPPVPDVPKPEFIRPPGALPEEAFLEKCTRCDECVKVCPENAIMKFVREDSVHHLTPVLHLRKSACVLCGDFPCVRACATGALVLPLSTRHVRMGVAVVNRRLCHAWADGMDCDYCVKECPFPGEAIFLDEERRPHVNRELCTGCGLCEHICPSRQSAIVVKRIEAA